MADYKESPKIFDTQGALGNELPHAWEAFGLESFFSVGCHSSR